MINIDVMDNDPYFLSCDCAKIATLAPDIQKIYFLVWCGAQNFDRPEDDRMYQVMDWILQSSFIVQTYFKAFYSSYETHPENRQLNVQELEKYSTMANDHLFQIFEQLKDRPKYSVLTTNSSFGQARPEWHLSTLAYNTWATAQTLRRMQEFRDFVRDRYQNLQHSAQQTYEQLHGEWRNIRAMNEWALRNNINFDEQYHFGQYLDNVLYITEMLLGLMCKRCGKRKSPGDN